MAWTDSETARVVAIEELLNQVQTAIQNLASKAQMRQLLLLKQAEVDALTTRVASLEAQLTVLQNSLE
jgi:polyhydroxyalkanoate synthesis regulator phasin